MASAQPIQTGGQTIPVITLNSPTTSDVIEAPQYKRAMAPPREFSIHNERVTENAHHGEHQEANNDDEEDEDLGTCLRTNSTRHHDAHIRRFWTKKSLDEVLTKARISKELQTYRSEEPALFVGYTVADLADTIFEHHRQVFAILVLLERGSSIMAVIGDGLKDTDLPLYTEVNDSKHRLYRGHGSASPLQLVRCLSGWKTFEREGFFRYQRALSPERLALSHDGRTPQHKDFDDEVVLPFVHEEKKEQGGFGLVSKVELHPDCHDFHGVLELVRSPCSFNRACRC